MPPGSLFSAYAEDFMKTYAVANNKPSERTAKARTLKHQLLPAFGTMRLDEIKTHPIEVLKAELLAKGKSPKLVNNVFGTRSAHISRCGARRRRRSRSSPVTRRSR
jgi:hypothetical protein